MRFREAGRDSRLLSLRIDQFFSTEWTAHPAFLRVRLRLSRGDI